MANYISYNTVVDYVKNLSARVMQEQEKQHEELHNKMATINSDIKNLRKKITLLEEGREKVKAEAEEKLACDKVEAERVLKSFQHKFDVFGIDLLKIDASIVNWTQAVHRCSGGMSAKHRSEFYNALDTHNRKSAYEYYSKNERYIKLSTEIQNIESSIKQLELKKKDMTNIMNNNINISNTVPDDLTDLDDDVLYAITEWLSDDHPDTIKIDEKGQLMVYWREVTIFFSDHEKIEFILND